MSSLLLLGEFIADKKGAIDFNAFKSRFKEKPCNDKP